MIFFIFLQLCLGTIRKSQDIRVMFSFIMSHAPKKASKYFLWSEVRKYIYTFFAYDIENVMIYSALEKNKSKNISSENIMEIVIRHSCQERLTNVLFD